jgi:hypothetical protein
MKYLIKKTTQFDLLIKENVESKMNIKCAFTQTNEKHLFLTIFIPCHSPQLKVGPFEQTQ